MVVAQAWGSSQPFFRGSSAVDAVFHVRAFSCHTMSVSEGTVMSRRQKKDTIPAWITDLVFSRQTDYTLHYLYIHTYTCTHVYTYIHTYTRTYIHTECSEFGFSNSTQQSSGCPSFPEMKKEFLFPTFRMFALRQRRHSKYRLRGLVEIEDVQRE
jgi:hypothetical protein